MPRSDNRSNNELRPIVVRHGFLQTAHGSVLISFGQTMVLCTASVVEEIPRWMPKDSSKGWLTAEYRMLPGSTNPRTPRSDKPDGRATEIQRLIGRSLRAVVDLEQIGPRTIYVDCDVLQADGGTRTTSINGAYLALRDAVSSIRETLPGNPIRDAVAAISVGIVDGVPMLDLDYAEDVAAEVDMNIVMTGSGKFIEIQGTGEEATFSECELQQLLELGKKGVQEIVQSMKQRDTMSGGV